MQGPDYFILISYFVLMLAIGGYFYRYMRGLKDYFSGGNQIPWWLSGVSFYMSSFSVFGFVSFSALAYKYGWVGVTLFWLMVPGTFVSVIFFSRKWRRARIDSPIEYLENRYSSLLRQLFAWQGIPVRIIDDALKLVAIGVFISQAFAINLYHGMLWSGLIMLTYTMMGGLWAVTVTDFIQFVIMAIAILILVPLALNEVGGITNFIASAEEGFFHLTHPEYPWVYIAATILLYILAYSSINWALIQRYYCVPREKDAFKVGLLVIVLQIIGPPLILIPAMAARKFLPDIANDATVYPLLCLKLLPAGMVGLIVAAMFSATMSMLSSDYNVCANVLTNDVYRRYIRPHASAKELVFTGRIMTLVVGLLVIATAMLLGGMSGEGLVRNMFKLFSIATAPVAIPMLLGLLSKKMTNYGALTGFFSGVSSGLLVFFLCPDKFEFLNTSWKQENILLIVTTIVTLSAGITVSMLFPVSDKERRRSENFFRKLQIPIGQMSEDIMIDVSGKKTMFSPFLITGISIICVGVMIALILPYVSGKIAFGLNAFFALLLFVIGGVMIMASRSSKSIAKE